MRYAITALLAVGLLTGSALTAPLGVGLGDGNPPGKRSPQETPPEGYSSCSVLGCIPPKNGD
ncbi:hypothetical protein LX32DRAFT_633311 [Colletotrichum zoysiae]|uniref:Uncharacterized protein n=1 Tax=Colletotrichum zoysiae TaxID=1216348 RepID=A0AAD9MAL2_9PEZI|nr:hypothetical protein LX32DRAFT_633311 [Colletotrichum zoysiae]